MDTEDKIICHTAGLPRGRDVEGNSLKYTLILRGFCGPFVVEDFN